MAEYLIINGTDSAVTSVGASASYDTAADQGANAGLVFTAALPGVQGNDITIEYVDDVTNPDPPTVEVTGTAIVVSIDSGVTLASEVETAVEAATALVTVANSGAETGAGTVVAQGPDSLAGGTADYIPAQSQKVVEVTDAQLADFVDAGCGVAQADVTYQERRRIARTLKYDKVTAVHVAA